MTRLTLYIVSSAQAWPGLRQAEHCQNSEHKLKGNKLTSELSSKLIFPFIELTLSSLAQSMPMALNIVQWRSWNKMRQSWASSNAKQFHSEITWKASSNQSSVRWHSTSWNSVLIQNWTKNWQLLKLCLCELVAPWLHVQTKSSRGPG